MSFFGKQFKKVKVENGPEFLENEELSEQITGLLRQKDSVSTFNKNADGTLSYVVKAGDTAILNQTLYLDKEVDYKTPDGMDTKVFFALQGDVLKCHMKFSKGFTVHIDRHFDANSLKLELYIEGGSTKATVYYDAL